MFPQQAHVLLMHTDGLRQQHRLPLGIDQCGIKVLNVTQAVTSQGQGEGAVTQTVVTNIKGTLALEGSPGEREGWRGEGQMVEVKVYPMMTTCTISGEESK
jgi:hypothetical protein